MEPTDTSMNGKVVAVTGANAGMGKVIARELAARGATVVCVCRDAQRGQAAVEEIRKATGNPRVEFMLCDLASQKSTRAFADEFKRTHPKLHVLVNNAGVVIPERRVTAEGLENTFALNHLGYFLLTHLLLDVLQASTPARVLNMASEAERMGKIDFEDLQMEKRYSPFGAYCRSKLANIMFTYDLAQRLQGTGVTVNAVHPGPVASRFGEELRGVMGVGIKLFRPFMRTPEKGAETAVYLASSPEVEGKSGLYWYNRRPIKSIGASYDPSIRGRLWEVSAQLTGVGALS
jgi:retinol dehydrogenase-14